MFFTTSPFACLFIGSCAQLHCEGISEVWECSGKMFWMGLCIFFFFFTPYLTLFNMLFHKIRYALNKCVIKTDVGKKDSLVFVKTWQLQNNINIFKNVTFPSNKLIINFQCWGKLLL